MEFNTIELKRAVSKLKPLIKTRTPLEVAKGILYANGSMTATDMTVHATLKVSTGLVPTDETFIIPQSAFDAIGKVSAETTTIEYDANGYVTVMSGKFKAKFATYNPFEFPKFESNAEVLMRKEINLSGFMQNLKSVMYAVATSENKGVMCGINIVADGKQIKFAALDGFRAAMAFGEECSEQFSVTVPVGFWTMMMKFTTDEAETATLTVLSDNKSLSLSNENFTIQTRLLEGQFVDVTSIIAKVNQTKSICVDRSELITALEMHSAAMKDNGKNNLIVFTVDAYNPEMPLLLSAHTQGSSFEYALPAEVSDIPGVFKIGFNATYITQAVKSLDSPTVLFKLDSPVSAALIYKAEKPSMDVSLVLPVRINE